LFLDGEQEHFSFFGNLSFTDYLRTQAAMEEALSNVSEYFTEMDVDISYAGDEEIIAILSVSGPLVEETAPALERVLEEQLALNKFKVIVNLENNHCFSDSGWDVFVSKIQEIRDNGGDLVLVNMSPDIYDVYELMEFSSILKSFDSLEEAIAYFTGDLKVKLDT
jgi:anti-sigma B factor antagonist